MTTIETERSQPSGSNVSLDEPNASEGASSTEGEKARVMSTVAPEMILPHQVTWYTDNVFYGFTDNNIGKIDDSSGSFKSGELNKVTDLLEGSNGLVQKCSLNDIMFLVMLMMTKSAADQRQSRYEDLAAKKVVAQKTADAVYELKMAEAKETYEKEIKAAEIQKTMGIVQIAIGTVSVVGGFVAFLGEIPSVLGKITSFGSKAVQSANKMANVAAGLANSANVLYKIGGGFVKFASKIVWGLGNICLRLQTIASITRALQLMANAASSTATIIQGAVQIDIAKRQRKAEFISAEAKLNQVLFEFNIQQLRNMQSSYRESNRNIQKTISSIKEILQQNQSTRLSIARNI